MSNSDTTSTDASGRRTDLVLGEHVTVELLAVGVAAVAFGGVLSAGLLPETVGFESSLGAVLVGIGVGVGIYSVRGVRQTASLEIVALGSAFITTAVVLFDGPWAAILFLWGIAMLALGLGAYGLSMLSQRGTQG